MTEKIIHIKIHPAAKKWLESTQKKAKGCVTITDRETRTVFEACLGRKNYRGKSRVSEGYETKYTTMKIRVPDWVFYNVGFEMTPFWQCTFSAYAYNRMMNEICTTVEAAAATGHGDRLNTIEAMLQLYGLEETLKTETVRKHYQRHHRKREKALAELYGNWNRKTAKKSEKWQKR